MDCFPSQRGTPEEDYDYSDTRVKTWSPGVLKEEPGIMRRGPERQTKDLCCQAYVQILFAEKGKWVPDSIGELMVYRMDSINDDKGELYLSFFSGPRQRFQIKISDIRKMYKPHPNLIVIVHGKTVMGLNFAIEHRHRVDIFMRQIKPNLPVTILAAKIRRAAENISDEMKRTATKIKNSLSIEPAEEKQANKINFRETQGQKVKELTPGKIAKRRSSDPTAYMKKVSDEFSLLEKPGPDNNMSKKATLRSPPILKSSNGKKYNTMDREKKVRFDSTVYKNKLPRSQSLRRHRDVDENETAEYSRRKDHVKEMILLWNSK
ncbi:hypothetical protein FO519_002917 [Halicephalobus sp. NKZ332]|nr:hypothetical protein FO519_002917 [Halicephalobus sp. NKZ332]